MEFLYQFVSEDLTYALGWTVIHSLWQAMIIGVVVAFAIMYLKNRSAKVRYEVATFSQFMVFVAALSTFLVYYDGGLSLDKFSSLTDAEIQQLAALSQEGMLGKSTLQLFVDFFNNNMSTIVLVWMLGATFFLLRMLGGLVYVQRLRYTNNQEVAPYWNRKLNALKSKIRLRKKVKLVESAIASVPMVIGYIKPVILLPIGAINNLQENEVEAILAHELAHIQRNDYLMNILLSVIEVLFYFNPAVWWIAANIRTERENCCDDTAVKLCGSSLTYAKALVSLQEIGCSAPKMAMPFSGSKNQLLHRVKRILNQPQNKSNIMEKMSATLLLMVTVTLFSIGAQSNYDYKMMVSENLEEASLLEVALIPPLEKAPKTIKLESLTFAPLPEPGRETDRRRYINNTDEGRVEMDIEDGTIAKITLDGQVIPSHQFGNYDHLINDLLADMDMIPGKSAPKNNQLTEAYAYQHKKTIRKERDDQTHIIFERQGQLPTEIIVAGETKSLVIDGANFDDGDTLVIVERRSSSEYNRSQPATLENASAFSWQEEKKLLERLSNIESARKRWDNSFNDRWKKLEKNISRLEQLNIKLLKNHSSVDATELLEKQAILNHRKSELEHKKAAFAEAKKQWYQAHEKEKEQINAQLNRQQRNANKLNLNTGPGHSCNNKKSQSSCKHNRNSKADHLTYGETATASTTDRFEVNGEGFLKFNSQVKRRLENELLEDLLIYSKSNYSFELNNQRLKVNGEKQSTLLFDKYLKLYEELTGIEMLGNSQIIIKNDNGHTETNYHSSNTQTIDPNKSFSCFSNSHGTYFFTATDSLDQNNEILLAMVELTNMIELSDYFEPNFDDTDPTYPLKIYLTECERKK